MILPDFLCDAIVPMFTSFHPDGSLDVRGLEAFTEWLIQRPLAALFPLGGTGAWQRLSHDERKLVIQTVIRVPDGRIPVMPGVHVD